MHHTFELILSDSNRTASLLFDIFKTDIAQLWAEEIKKGYPLYENDRFTEWPESNKDEAFYQGEFKKHIDVINNYENIIKLENYNQQTFLNILHKHFEDLRGHVDYSTVWYNYAPVKVQESVDKLNILIHEYENYLTEKNCGHQNPTIVTTFKDRPKYKLQEEHYKYFTHFWQHGTVYINYCEVGKPLLDVFKDQDEHVGNDAVRPQSVYSADFMIKFGPSIPEEFARKKEKRFWQWFELQNLDIDRSRAALGMIPVAKISQEIDINKLTGFNKVIKCIV